jgi:hypothetical protein
VSGEVENTALPAPVALSISVFFMSLAASAPVVRTAASAVVVRSVRIMV